jgi:hypothetical protein
MTSFDHTTNRAATMEKLDIWRCGDGCGFHLRAGSVVLTFSADEMEVFLQAAGRCYLGETSGHVQVPTSAGPTADQASRHRRDEPAADGLDSMLEH